MGARLQRANPPGLSGPPLKHPKLPAEADAELGPAPLTAVLTLLHQTRLPSTAARAMRAATGCRVCPGVQSLASSSLLPPE